MQNEMENNYFKESIDFSQFVNAVRFNVFRILLIIAVFLGLWFFYYTGATKIYSIKSLIQIEKSSVRPSSYEDMIFASNDETILDERMIIYKSKSNMSKLINNMQLNVLINGGGLQLAENKELQLKKLHYNFKLGQKTKTLYLVNNGESYDLESAAEDINFKNLEWDKDYNREGLSFNFLKPQSSLTKFTINLYEEQFFQSNFLSGLTLSKFSTGSRLLTSGSLIEVSFLTSNPEFGIALIDTANDIYVRQSVNKNILEAQQSLTYINDQIEKIGSALRYGEENLNKFKMENITLDIDAEILNLLEQSNMASNQLKQIDLQISEYESLYLPGNPILERAYKTKEVIREQYNSLNERIISLPQTQQEYIDLLREVEVNQAIYQDLLSKKLEYSLLEASTLGDVIIIDNASLDSQISPLLIQSFVMFLGLGMLLALSYAFIREFIFSGIRLPSHVETYHDLRVLGIIPKINEIENFKDSDKEAINFAATNLMLSTSEIYKSKQSVTIAICAATSQAGKTFTSKLISEQISKQNKKVLLIDNDYRRGDLHKFFNVQCLENIIFNKDIKFEDFKITENLYFIPRPKGKSQESLSIFSSPSYREFFEKIKEEFDYIVIDTAPVLSVSDTLFLTQFSDINLGIARHEYTTDRDVKSMRKELKAANQDIDYILYNCFEKPAGYYGYDYYAYKYYGYDYYSDKSED